MTVQCVKQLCQELAGRATSSTLVKFCCSCRHIALNQPSYSFLVKGNCLVSATSQKREAAPRNTCSFYSFNFLVCDDSVFVPAYIKLCRLSSFFRAWPCTSLRL